MTRRLWRCPDKSMQTLSFPPVFTLDLVPDGWIITSTGGPRPFFELKPPDRSAAIQISVYPRDHSALKSGQAKDLLHRFVNVRPVEGSVRLAELPEAATQQRAFAWYANRDEDGTLYEWYAVCILWPHAMLMCSCNAAPGNALLGAAEIIIAAIQPHEADG